MTNRYGVDVPYFKKELKSLSDSLDNRTPDELFRYLTCLAKVAKPTTKHNRKQPWNSNPYQVTTTMGHGGPGFGNSIKQDNG
jgi:hypothetical protein